MNPTQLWAVFTGRRRLVLSLFGAVVALVLGAALWRAPLYTTTATVVLDPRPDTLSAPAPGGAAAASYIATQSDVLRSERVARRTVAGLTPATRAAWWARWQQETAGRVAFEPWAVALIGRHLLVRPAREGGVVAVSFTANDAGQAAEVANTAVRAYTEVALQMQVEPARDQARFLEERARAARLALEAAQARLSRFQRDNGVMMASERLDLEDARLGQLSTQLTALQALSAESASRQAQASGLQADRLQEVLASSAVNQIKADKGRIETQLQQLSTRLGDNHPQVVELRAQLAQTQVRLDAETRRVAGSVDLSDRINQQRVAQTRNALKAQQAELLRMKALRDDGLVLQREVEQAQSAYDAVQQRGAQSALQGGNARGQAVWLSVAEPPIEPSSPPLVLHVALALLLGGLLAGGTALALEWRSRRVRCAADVVEGLQLPLLVSMPRVAMKGN